jgi:hypothetical protein
VVCCADGKGQSRIILSYCAVSGSSSSSSSSTVVMLTAVTVNSILIYCSAVLNVGSL